MNKNKRGISVIVGYVLLVVVVISISILVYQWLKSYVPTEVLSCPDGVAISIPNYIYNCSNRTLNFTIENTGTFSIAGYFIHAKNNTNQELATIDLSPYYRGIGSVYLNAILYSNYLAGVNSKDPGMKIYAKDNGFIIPSSLGNITNIEVTPIRYVSYKGQTRFASCGNAKVNQKIECSS